MSEIKPHLAISVYFSMRAAQMMNKSDPEHDYREQLIAILRHKSE